ncbi:MAG: LrgB family protein [Marinifilaceae bacterium]
MEMLNSKVFLLTLTVGIYLLSCILYKRVKWGIFNPIIISIMTICFILLIFDIEYSVYKKQTEFIDFLLGPSVVALGYKLYEQYDRIKPYIVVILFAIFTGSLTSLLSVIFIGRLLDVSPEIVASLEPKSVTTPIAISITEQLNGIPAITVVVVIGVGVLGAVLGPRTLKMLGIDTPIATGLALGATAHGLGTAKAMEMGALQGAISGMAIGLMGVITAILVPILEALLS